MFGIGGWDWFTVGLYFVVIIVIGVHTSRRIKDTSDFFIGGRRFGKAMMVFFSFGAGTNGNQAVTVASGTYRAGMSGIWWQWLWLFATPFYWLIAPVFRRMRAVTTGDYFDIRYGPGVGALYAVVGILQLSANMGVMLLGAGTVVKALSGGQIPLNVAIPALTALFIFYGVAGGLGAAIITDFIQGILTILLSFMVLPFALHAVGGMRGLYEKINDADMFRIVAPGEMTLFFIAMLALNAILGIVCQPHTMGVCAAGRKEMDGRVGFAGGNLLKRICTIAWMMTGLCAVVLYPNLSGSKIDETYGLMARDYLPFAGLVGVFLASMLASVMSSCDAFMVSCAGLFTQNIYRRFLAPSKSERHYIAVGRISSVVIVSLALVFAFSFEGVVEGLKVFWKFTALMAAAFWVGLFWRRATAAGAWAGTAATFLVFFITTLPFFTSFAHRNLPEAMVIWDKTEVARQSTVVNVRLDTGERLEGGRRTWSSVYRLADGAEIIGVAEEIGMNRSLGTVKVRLGDGRVVANAVKTSGWRPIYADAAGNRLRNVVEEDPPIGARSAAVFVQGESGEITEEAIRKWQPAYRDTGGRVPAYAGIAAEAAASTEWELRYYSPGGGLLPGRQVEVTPRFLDSWQILFYLIAGLLTTIIVSLLTPRPPKERLDRLYACLRTPVGDSEPHLAAFTLPEGVQAPPPNNLIRHPDFEIPRPTFVGLAGFAVLWVAVGLMIAFVYWLAGLGVPA